MNATTQAVWLVFIHMANGTRDKRQVYLAMRKMKAQLAPHVTVYLILFGPTIRSMAYLQRWQQQNPVEILLVAKNDGLHTVAPVLQSFTQWLVAHHIKIDALCVWSHGSGFALGPWKGHKEPFIAIDTFTQLVIAPFPTMKLVCFDACLQGSMSCLYEMPKFVAYVVASPAYHPYTSILVTKAFGQLKKHQRKDAIGDYAHSINCEWHTLSKHRFKCMLVLDTAYFEPILQLFQKYRHLLRCDKTTQIEKEENILFDLYLAAERVPELQQVINKCIAKTCDTCKHQCHRRVHGPSFETKSPCKWKSAFYATKWSTTLSRSSQPSIQL